MKKPIFIIAYVFSIWSPAQGEAEIINKQVWKPFIESYSSWDAKTFNSLHSDQMIQINSKEIRLAARYKKQCADWFAKASKEGYEQSIELRFEGRIVSGDIAFESGYYAIKITKPDGQTSDYYARFHFILRKEDGAWKITQDWSGSTINGVKISVEDFDKLDPFKP